MKNLRLFPLLSLTTGVFMLISCSKGSTGPAGAVGPAGPDSVSYSAWAPLKMTYAGNNSNGDSVFTQTINTSAITSAVLSQGSVIGYVLVADPLNGDSSIVNATLALSEYFSVGKIDLVAYGSDPSGLDYRYVIIPGKISVSTVSGVVHTYTPAELSQLNYTTLTGLLNIPAKSGGNITGAKFSN